MSILWLRGPKSLNMETMRMMEALFFLFWKAGRAALGSHWPLHSDF